MKFSLLHIRYHMPKAKRLPCGQIVIENFTKVFFGRGIGNVFE
jgi:hypothetical protein